MTASDWDGVVFSDLTSFLVRGARGHDSGTICVTLDTTGIVRRIPAHAAGTVHMTRDIPGLIGGFTDHNGGIPDEVSGIPDIAMSLTRQTNSNLTVRMAIKTKEN